MGAIKTTFGTGGSGLTPTHSLGQSDLAGILRDIAADLAAIKSSAPVATIAQAALPAFTDPPGAAEMAALRALVNELRALLVELRASQSSHAAVTLLTTAP